ncbi:MAG: ArsB/NhaD family transporter [Bacillota bacterium]
MPGNYQVYLAIIVFLVTYSIIVSEKFHRTVAAFAGAAIVVLAGITPPEKAVASIDWNTIGLLVGMMIIVGLTRETGVFEFLAIKAAQAAGGYPLAILASLGGVTAILSSVLDNVTTVLLIVPVTFAIANKLKLNPLPFLVAEILTSNIGGTATLIGDPPNIMIGSASHLGFMDFVINLTPVVILIHMLTVFILQLIYRKGLLLSNDRRNGILELDARAELKNLNLLRKSIIVLGLVIVGFLLHQYLHLESSVIALSGAALLLVITRTDPEEPISFVEWPAIFFFVGLFIIVGALEEVGIISALAKLSLELTGGQMILSGMLVMWVSALASSFVDNIPFVATMIPLLKELGELAQMSVNEQDFLWWCLSLGACLGGNGTIIGASANVIVAGIAEKRGIYITFTGFMKVAFPLMLMSLVISSVYMILWFLLPRILIIPSFLALALLAALFCRLQTQRLNRTEDEE